MAQALLRFVRERRAPALRRRAEGTTKMLRSARYRRQSGGRLKKCPRVAAWANFPGKARTEFRTVSKAYNFNLTASREKIFFYTITVA